MFSILSTNQLAAADAARLRRVEKNLERIMNHLGIGDAEAGAAASGSLPAQIRTLADAGQKIAAIKEHRELLGSDLRTAKDAIDAYLGRQRANS